MIEMNARINNRSSSLHITHSSVVLGKKRKNFEEMFVFETSEHSVQTADGNSKLTKKSIFNNFRVR